MAENRQKILVVDDDQRLRDLLNRYLGEQGFTVKAVDGAAAMDKALNREGFDLIVLDLMMPGEDGLSVCRRLRGSKDSVPIIMLTAKGDDVDRIVGLEMGADDYLPKPFNPRELVARVRAMLRRANRTFPEGQQAAIHLGDLSIDPGRREVLAAGELVELRTQEFELLLTLAEHQRMVLSREQLLKLAWGYDYPGQTRTVDVHVAQLRKKLSASSVRIETVTGVGYKLVM